MKKRYAITDRSGRRVKAGTFSEPEVRMAAKAGFRVFEINDKNGEYNMEITQGLTGLFEDNHGEFKD